MALRIALSLIATLVSSASVAQPQVLFEGTFQRPDGTALGAGWTEFSLRGDQAPRANDTAWSLRGGTLSYSANGTGAYVEDFIATAQAFPVDGTRVEFELRAVTGTRQGYVGPGFLWVDEPLRKRGAYNLDGTGPAYLGAGLFYRWENQGTGGALLYAGSPSPAVNEPDRKVPGVNDRRFVKHAITVKNGTITWEADGAVLMRAPLAQPLPAGARRRFMISNRLYDSGVPQSVELRNLRILGSAAPAGGEPPATSTGAPGETWVKATGAPEFSNTLFAYAFPGPTLVIEAANSTHDIAWDRAHWRIGIRGNALGRFPAAVSFNLAPVRGWVSGGTCTATITRLDARFVDGSFNCPLQGFDGERATGDVSAQGSFHAEVQP